MHSGAAEYVSCVMVRQLQPYIKFGSKPPKYGVLFKLAEISNGPRDKRGRIARAYATKISIGLKADYFTKNFIAGKLKEDLERTIKTILIRYY